MIYTACDGIFSYRAREKMNTIAESENMLLDTFVSR